MKCNFAIECSYMEIWSDTQGYQTTLWKGTTLISYLCPYYRNEHYKEVYKDKNLIHIQKLHTHTHTSIKSVELVLHFQIKVGNNKKL